MSSAAPELRAVYRNILRELPLRQPSILANPSPLQKYIRAGFADSSARTSLAEADQYLQYLKNQRVYTTLIERYNPGMNMVEEERIRLTARRVGMDLPVEVTNQGKDK